MWFHEKKKWEIQRENGEWNTNLEPTKGKKIVFCVALWEKRKCDFSFTQDIQGR